MCSAKSAITVCSATPFRHFLGYSRTNSAAPNTTCRLHACPAAQVACQGSKDEELPPHDFTPKLSSERVDTEVEDVAAGTAKGCRPVWAARGTNVAAGSSRSVFGVGGVQSILGTGPSTKGPSNRLLRGPSRLIKWFHCPWPCDRNSQAENTKDARHASFGMGCFQSPI